MLNVERRRMLVTIRRFIGEQPALEIYMRGRSKKCAIERQGDGRCFERCACRRGRAGNATV